MVRLWLLPAALLPLACSSVLGLDELSYDVADTSGSGGSAGDATQAASGGSVAQATGSGPSAGGATSSSSAAGGGGSAPLSCPSNLAGPDLVDVGSFCIDATEVSNQHYQDFLNASPSPSFEPECSWNTDLVPTGFPFPAGAENQPVAGVDWCDAFAFCQWAGKRLCGRIGGGANPPADLADATASEWHFACSNGGATIHPYGDSYEPNACWGTEQSSNGPYLIDGGSLASCTGTMPPFDAVYDLVGNVHEWTDECAAYTGADDECFTRGGGAPHGSPDNSCPDDSWPLARNGSWSDGGFRCCADER